MQRCPYCKVDIAGEKSCCPLCGGQLIGTPDPASESFPQVKRPRMAQVFVLRLLALIAFSLSVLCVMINIGISTRIWWSAFVAAGAACVWIAAYIGVCYRRDILQNIAWQVILVPGLSVAWDHATGWRAWSISFVLPCVVILALVSMLILSLALHLPVHAYAGYLTVVCCLGILSLVLVLCDKLTTPVPALIAAGLSLIVLAVLLLFHWQTFRQEFMRRFHL